MSKYILTVTLNPAIDKMVYVPNFKSGFDFRESGIFLSAGGKGINVSQALDHLGIKSVATGFLGNIGANYFESELDKQDIQHVFTWIAGCIRTNLTILDLSSSKVTRILERGPKISQNDVRTFKVQFSALLKGANIVVLSGRNITGAKESLYAELILIAKRNKVLTILDTSGDPLSLGIEQSPFLVKLNIQEAEEYFRKKIRSKLEIYEALKELYLRGIKIPVITDGAKGAYAYDGKESFCVIPPRIISKSPVGCGDAFISGFLAAYTEGKLLSECLRFATACGCANAKNINPGQIIFKDVKNLLKEVVVKKS